MADNEKLEPDLEKPQPGAGVDGLSYSSQNAQR